MQKKQIKSIFPTSDRILNSMTELICIVNKKGYIVLTNSAFSRVIGCVSGDRCQVEGECNCDKDCEVIKESTFKAFEIKLHGRVYKISADPLREADGSYQYLMQTWRDITGEIHLRSKIVSQNQSMLKDLEVARQLQNSLLLEKLPVNNFVRFDAIYHPCYSVGGDFYDVFMLNDDKVAFYIADVSGHGVSAAMLTVFIAQAIRSIINASDSNITPNDILFDACRQFVDIKLDHHLYITAWVGIYDSKNGELSYCNAGHVSSPILELDGEWERLNAPGFPICSWVEMPDYKSITKRVSKGSKLLMYSDGLSDIWRLKESVLEENDEMDTPDKVALYHLINDGFEDCLKNIFRAVTKSIDIKNIKDDVAMLLMECM